jgi:hypothetical protein
VDGDRAMASPAWASPSTELLMDAPGDPRSNSNWAVSTAEFEWFFGFKSSGWQMHLLAHRAGLDGSGLNAVGLI